MIENQTIELDLENVGFQEAYDLITNTNQTFFLTGKAGTGKSTFLRYFVETIPKNFVVFAPTGIAATNVRGVTIHSFFQLPPRPFLPDDPGITRFKKGSDKRRIIQALDTLFIDEVSMVRIDLLYAIDRSLRINGGDPLLPFGGKQVVLVGDVFQLPPVPPKDKQERQILEKNYCSLYFFDAECYQKACSQVIELQKLYRQTDPDFIEMLGRFRMDTFTGSDLKEINKRVIKTTLGEKGSMAITLTSMNEMANNENQVRLAKIQSEEFLIEAVIEGTFEPEYFPTSSELHLKVGAQVMFVKNDIGKRWVNGTIGIVTDIQNPTIEVQDKDGNIFQVKRDHWNRIKYTYNLDTRRIDEEVIGTFEQFPLKLAWATTIHKSQGQTFDRIAVDLGSGAFCGGQTYVALSRVTTLDGLCLKKTVTMADIFVEDEIRQFAESCGLIPAVCES